MTDGLYYKIGQSVDPEKRLQSLKTGNPNIKLICYGCGMSEKELHAMFRHRQYKREWFNLNTKELSNVKDLINGLTPPISELAKNKARSMKHESYSKYIISFGKYKGTRIIEMKSAEQLEYIRWYINNVYNIKPKKERTLKDSIFAWWYQIN